jgi:hypothetical protein
MTAIPTKSGLDTAAKIGLEIGIPVAAIVLVVPVGLLIHEKNRTRALLRQFQPSPMALRAPFPSDHAAYGQPPVSELLISATYRHELGHTAGR